MVDRQDMGEDAGDAPEEQIKTAKPGMKNAFETLMSPKRKRNPSSPPPKTSDPKLRLNLLHGRDALGAYIAAPATFPTTRVLSHDADFVIIRDLYPKSSVHLLLLPRDASKTKLHPFDAFADAAFRALVLPRIADARRLVASELRRVHGAGSTAEQARNAAMERGDDVLPPGRDWEAEVMTGVHAVPSMSHLHIHILSVDRHSDAVKHRKHYNSFATRFLVPVEDMPLAAGDERRHPGRAGFLNEDLRCWRCGRNFGNKFARLKEHLQEEWETWREV
ncbi:hypothetical protein FH972_022808 [Carpinus fangiana]|uniref:Aprataxin-like protein n=1 Tax=Carpinus fangiana TaxID=176857 RepID=A0A5N6KTB2_9ROSI|nr:hypothetical protein FH972_022808 [Carpinus fangiana]